MLQNLMEKNKSSKIRVKKLVGFFSFLFSFERAIVHLLTYDEWQIVEMEVEIR